MAVSPPGRPTKLQLRWLLVHERQQSRWRRTRGRFGKYRLSRSMLLGVDTRLSAIATMSVSCFFCWSVFGAHADANCAACTRVSVDDALHMLSERGEQTTKQGANVAIKRQTT
jgi:hypothetical protein